MDFIEYLIKEEGIKEITAKRYSYYLRNIEEKCNKEINKITMYDFIKAFNYNPKRIYKNIFFKYKIYQYKKLKNIDKYSLNIPVNLKVKLNFSKVMEKINNPNEMKNYIMEKIENGEYDIK